jgi:hypothetical protein
MVFGSDAPGTASCDISIPVVLEIVPKEIHFWRINVNKFPILGWCTELGEAAISKLWQRIQKRCRVR